LKIHLNFPQIREHKEYQTSFRIHRSRDVDDIYRKLEDIFKSKYGISDPYNELEFIVLYKNVLLKRENSL